jgi:4-cresol dehydrogenase (hydroxylating)
VKSAFERIPGAEFASRKYPGNAVEPEVEVRHKAFAGIPGLEHLNILGWAGPEGAHLGFSPISPMTAAHAQRQATMVRATAARFGFDYGTAFGALGRRLNHVFMIVFDRTNAEETARAQQMFEALVIEGAAEGYAEYRTHLEYMDLVARQYAFNDHAHLRFNERLKDLLDPNGILSPGKQGIWPRALREQRQESKS